MEKKGKKRKEQAEETRNRIYGVAIEIMDRKGFGNLTIAEISRKAGVSVGAFYHYFASKQDILAEIFRKADRYFSERVENRLAADNPGDQIVEYFDHYARFNIQTGAATTRHLFNPTINYFMKEDRAMILLLRDIIVNGQISGRITRDEPADTITRDLFISARGVVFDWSLHNGSYDLEEAMRRNMERIVRTLTPSVV